MKKKNFVLLINLICFSCSSRDYEPRDAMKTAIAVSIDETDPLMLKPEADPILSLYGFKNDKNIAASFKINSVTDKQLNPTQEVYLQNGYITEKANSEEDPYFRQKLVMNFYTKTRLRITDLNTVNSSILNHSECLSSISENLQWLKKSKAQKNILLVFSDLQENSDLLNCYLEASQKLLDKNPAGIIKLFDSTHLLPSDLKEMTIFFVFQPKDREEDQKFARMVYVYRILLEQRGAKVIVQAQNDFYNIE